jgi:hypothetical protein
MRASSPSFLTGLVLGAMLSALAADGPGGRADARQPQETPGLDRENEDNAELARLHDEDQADRRSEAGRPIEIDPSVLVPRDRARQARVKALYRSGAIRTGKDYRRAAMVLQHADSPEDHLLAHEFCVVALARGEDEARWLAAATEDRFLMNIGRPQRFGTQYRSIGQDDPLRLYEVGPGVTDGLRRELRVPSLEEARKREAEMNSGFRIKQPGASRP